MICVQDLCYNIFIFGKKNKNIVMMNILQKKLNVENLLRIIVITVLFLGTVCVPIKESYLCNNGLCSIKDYSLLITYNRIYDLNNIHLYVRHGRMAVNLLSPISKCDYLSFNRAYEDEYRLKNNNYINSKHISRFIIILLFCVFPLIAICSFVLKKNFLIYFLILLLIRLIYILLI